MSVNSTVRRAQRAGEAHSWPPVRNSSISVSIGVRFREPRRMVHTVNLDVPRAGNVVGQVPPALHRHPVAARMRDEVGTASALAPTGGLSGGWIPLWSAPFRDWTPFFRTSPAGAATAPTASTPWRSLRCPTVSGAAFAKACSRQICTSDGAYLPPVRGPPAPSMLSGSTAAARPTRHRTYTLNEPKTISACALGRLAAK